MKSHYSSEERYRIVNEERKNKSVKERCVQYDISRTTYYSWVKKYKVNITSEKKEFTYRDIQILEEKNKKLQNMIDIYNKSGCTCSSSLDEKIEAIFILQKEYSIHSLCKAFDILRSTYYHRMKAKETETEIQRKDVEIKEKIEEILELSKYRMGSRKNNNQYFVNRLNQEFTQEKPNKAWVSDTTHLRVNKEKFYLCVIIDLFSRKVIAYKLSRFHDINFIMDTFQIAYTIRNGPKYLLFYSDQGSQYTSFLFREHLNELGIKQSFSKSGYPYDNAVIESFFSAMKREEVNVKEYKNLEELIASIDEYIKYYNEYRPHQSLNYKRPNRIESNQDNI